MAKAIKNERYQFMITWPHCDVPKDIILELLRDHWISTYICVAAEKHADGEEHRHAYVKCSEGHSIPRKKMPYIYDIVKRWQISDSGNVSDVEFRWASQFFEKEDLKEKNCPFIPKPGEDFHDPVIQSVMWRRWHPQIEVVKSPKDALKYVKKHGDIISWGICPCKETLTRKEKNDLLLNTNLTKLVDDGNIGLLALPALKKAIDLYNDERQSDSFAPRIVHWYWGETGTGKTRAAIDEAKANYVQDEAQFRRGVWISHTSSEWFDGYCGQPAAILDDIRSASWNFGEMLRLLDRYPIDVPIKGGFRKWLPREIWITAPVTPRELYRNYQTGEPYDGIEQLERRITDMREFRRGDSEDEDPDRAAIDSFQQKEVKTQWD